MKIGKAIKEIRKQKKISVKEFAAKIRHTEQSIKLIESATYVATTKELTKICKALGVPKSILLFMSLETKDVSPKKVELFKALSPAVNGLLKSVIKN